MEGERTCTGWVGYTAGPGGKDHLPPDVRAEIERREAARSERRGRLLCEVQVRVYEHDHVEPDVAASFPAEALLGPESDSAEIAAAVARARDQLSRWR
jgi:hypothetical protein